MTRYIQYLFKKIIIRIITNLKVTFLSKVFYLKHEANIKFNAKNTLKVMKIISDLKVSSNSELPIHLALGHENLSASVAFGFLFFQIVFPLT